MCRITYHGIDRIKERCGVSKKASKNFANRAFENGITHSYCKGSLKRYLDKLFFEQKTANQLRIYMNKIWIFNNDLLITTFELPQKYRSTVKNILQKKINA